MLLFHLKFLPFVYMYNFLMTLALLLNSCFPMKRKGNSERKQWGDGNNEKEKKNQINIACMDKLWKQKVEIGMGQLYVNISTIRVC